MIPATALVVDDEEMDRTVMTRIVRTQFTSVVEAESYHSAWEAFERKHHAIQFLVADISLPDGNGCALAIAMQKLQPNLRVLFVSGHVGEEVCKYYGLEVTDQHFVRKPFTAEQLLQGIEKSLNADLPGPKLHIPTVGSSGS
jgi:DNA-binding NtrC family response regulator